MNEIYWITRLGNLNTLFIVLTVLSAFVVIFTSFAMLINYDEKVITKETRLFKKAFKISLPTLLFAIIGLVLTPTTKESLMIYGIGGTIDYIKSNDKAKELPDEFINALDKWVDTINEQK